MFGWFKKKTRPLDPESDWVISLEQDTLRVTDPAGQSRSVSLRDLSGVVIETNDSGPLGADIWWLLFGSEDVLACAYPQGATGEKVVLDILMKLPAFDHASMIQAMSSTENATFSVWRKVR